MVAFISSHGNMPLTRYAPKVSLGKSAPGGIPRCEEQYVPIVQTGKSEQSFPLTADSPAQVNKPMIIALAEYLIIVAMTKKRINRPATKLSG